MKTQTKELILISAATEDVKERRAKSKTGKEKLKMSKTKKKTRSSKKMKSKKAKKVKTTKPKKRYLIRELTAFIESKGPDKVTFSECRKLARQIKPDTSYNETYHLILVGRVKSHLKKSTPKKKKKK